jgi:hypothetical protein
MRKRKSLERFPQLEIRRNTEQFLWSPGLRSSDQ